MTDNAADPYVPPWREFLMHGTRTAKLATVRRDGRPHIAPIAFVLDGSDLVFSTAKTSVKGLALQRSRQAALAIDDERPPYPFVTVEGTVSISEDLDEMYRWCRLVGARYMGADHATEMGRRNAVPGQLLIRVKPTRVVAWLDGKPRQTLDLQAPRPDERQPQ
jgi:PPOX class probable F420-dependent enzyme